MLFKIRKAKLLQILSPYPMNQQESPYCHKFLTVTSSYHSKVTPIGAIYAEKIDEALLLYVSKLAFPASLLAHISMCCSRANAGNMEQAPMNLLT